MDYDGQGQHALTHLNTISLSPRVSPDNDRIAFASLGRQGWAIRMYSLVLGRVVGFNSRGRQHIVAGVVERWSEVSFLRGTVRRS